MRRSWIIAALSFLPFIPGAFAQDVRSSAQITVERLVLDVYVTKDDGTPVTNLTPEDFRVRVARRDAEVESAEWIDMSNAASLAPGGEPSATGDAPVARGRVMILFFQTDFQRERAVGQMRIIQHSKGLLDSITPADRVAVVSFDSHLKLQQDFTNDRELLQRAISNSLRFDSPVPAQSAFAPSLASVVDWKEAKRAATPEKALRVLGRGLLNIEGAKSLLLFGWGLGEYNRGHLIMDRDYDAATRVLDASRTSVFSIDITQADYHSLEGGLDRASHDTGGFYTKTFVFPNIALARIQRTLSGRYELTVKAPPLAHGTHAIDVRVNGRRYQVMARKHWAKGDDTAAD